MDKILRYKIHSKLFFFNVKKIAHLKKKKKKVSEQCTKTALFTIFSEQCMQYTVHVNCTVQWTVQLTWIVTEKHDNAALAHVRKVFSEN